ncbi:MAG: indolepyruvate ferredoxin oxidoreductase subunit alpha [Eubacteriales bacterium]
MKKLMLGNEAYARGAYEAGVTVAAAYPGTPSTEILESIVKYDEVKAQWSPNEKVALEVAIGASMGGARALCMMKHVGLNVAADPLFTASYTGVNGGLVVIVADDPGMHSSQNEQDSRFYARSAHLPMLEAADSAEAKELMKAAYDISEEYDTPVLVRTHTRISHSQSLVNIGKREEIPLKEYKKDVMKYVMMPGMAKKRHIIVEERMKKLTEAANSLDINTVEMLSGDIGVVTSGICYNYVKEALPNASVLKLGMVYPINMDMVKDFAKKVKKLYVIEELEPFIEDQLKANGIKCEGKALFTVQGEYSVNKIKKAILNEDISHKELQELPQRPPVLCPGCPHRAVYYVLNKLNMVACGDIGCYTLGALPPLFGIDSCVCMGASIGMATGIEKARGEEFAKNTVAVIGDSTFIHSGITGLIDMVYNAKASTVIILDNSTTGMTGHQDHPGTGKNAKGEAAPKLDLVKLINAIGVNNVRVVDPFEIEDLTKAIKEETAKKEISVIIAKRPCELLEKGKSRGKALKVTDCRQCGLCLKLGCPAIINTDNGVVIDETLCNGCGLCKKGMSF